MEKDQRVNFWNNVHTEKQIEEFSWYQKTPQTSLDFIFNLHLPFDKKIIDVGGGDSFLVDFLISSGFTEVSVLDISEKAIEKVRERLGFASRKVKWLQSDILDFKSDNRYDLWHDRAAFHFLSEEEEISKYVELVTNYIEPGGYLIIGVFSETGPDSCSGIKTRNYSIGELKALFGESFECLSCKNVDHFTPLHKVQKFIFCCFQRK